MLLVLLVLLATDYQGVTLVHHATTGATGGATGASKDNIPYIIHGLSFVYTNYHELYTNFS